MSLAAPPCCCPPQALTEFLKILAPEQWSLSAVSFVIILDNVIIHLNDLSSHMAFQFLDFISSNKFIFYSTLAMSLHDLFLILHHVNNYTSFLNAISDISSLKTISYHCSLVFHVHGTTTH